MVSKPACLLAMIFIILVSCGGHSAPINPEKPAYREGEILVRFEKNIDKERIESMLRQMGLKIKHTYTIPNLYLLTITDRKTVAETLKILHDHPEVMYAEPNYKIQLTE